MNCIDAIIDRLDGAGYNASVNDYAISWLNSVGDRSLIELNNFDCWGENLAWFQRSDNDEYLLKVYEGNDIFYWKPITYNAYFGFSCHLLEWYKEHLIFIYKEKHDTYICVIKNKQVQTFNFNGYDLARSDDVILFQESGQRSIVRRIKIPALIEMDSWPVDKAKEAGLLPQTLFAANSLSKR